MSKGVVYLANMRDHRADWSKEDLAHLGRAANFVQKLGLAIETDRGVTDEGEPWFVFCDADSDEVLVHFGRIGGEYIVCAPFLESSLTGRAFANLIERFLDRYAAVFSSHTNDSVVPSCDTRTWGGHGLDVLDPNSADMISLNCNSTRLCERHAEKPVALMTAEHVRKLRDELGATPGAARNRLKALRALFR